MKKSDSVFLSNLHHAYAQTDGTYAFPNSREGDMLKRAKVEIEQLISLLNGIRARQDIENQISEEILNGAYDPVGSDFDYENDFHHKLQEKLKKL